MMFVQNTFRGFGNCLFNGFSTEIEEKDKGVGIKPAHFKPVTEWQEISYRMVDVGTQEEYCNDKPSTIRLKCAAALAGGLIAQPIGLTLNLLNRVGKVVTGAHLWHPSDKKYSFTARLGEWAKDLLIIITTPLILIGLFFSALCGATISPYNGRKLFATLERFAYSGGYQRFHDGLINRHDYLLAPCFQPEPKVHLGGGKMGDPDVW